MWSSYGRFGIGGAIAVGVVVPSGGTIVVF